MPIDGSTEPEPVVTGESANWRSRLSPDGRWLAYLSDSSGKPNIYIRPFERAGGPVRVSIDEGTRAQWAPDGESIYFVANDKMMVAPVETTGSLRVGAAEEVFDIDERVVGPLPIAPDGKKFLALRVLPGTDWHYGVRVVLGWADQLE